MSQERTLYRVSNSWVVAVPRRVREHLKLRGGESVYWHLIGPREVVLTPHAQRQGGRPAGKLLARQLEEAHRENDRLRAQLQARPVAAYSEAFDQGYMKGITVSPLWRVDIKTLTDQFRALRDEVAGLRTALPHRRRRARPSPPPPTEDMMQNPAKVTTCRECSALVSDDEPCPSCGSREHIPSPDSSPSAAFGGVAGT